MSLIRIPFHLGIVGLLSVQAIPVFAQSRPALEQRVEALEQRIGALERQRSGSERPAETGTATAQSQKIELKPGAVYAVSLPSCRRAPDLVCRLIVRRESPAGLDGFTLFISGNSPTTITDGDDRFPATRAGIANGQGGGERAQFVKSFDQNEESAIDIVFASSRIVGRQVTVSISVSAGVSRPRAVIFPGVPIR